MSSLYQPQEIIKDKYRITEVLGKGGVAITYSAIALETNSAVAIKVISLKQLDDWKQIELFEREAEVLKQLEHPAIPKYIDYFTIETDKDKLFYLVQEIAPGKSLHQLVDSGWRATEKEVKDIARQVLKILSYLHSLDPPVIHRDIKPNNLIRSDEGRIYLVDFGAVKNTYYNTLMQGSTVVGTYGYMSPEQFRGKALPPTDLYSLGATLLYLLTHRSPTELPQDTLKLDFRNYINIDDSFADWLEKILEPDLEDRFSNADTALAELDKSQQKKKRKFITSISAIALLISLFAGFNSYKWFFLSHIGYLPSGICENINILNYYLDKGGKANAYTNTIINQNIPLLICVLRNNSLRKEEKIKNIELLIDRGADVNAEVEKQILITPRIKYRLGYKTALFQLKDIEIAEILIKHGANVNFKDEYHLTPLSNAVLKGQQDVVELLIKYDANVSNIDRFGHSILLKAIEKANEENNEKRKNIVKLLIFNNADIHARNEYGSTALLKTHHLDIAELLIKRGADVNTANKHKYTPLLMGHNFEYKKFLLENGADINARDGRGSTLLIRTRNKKVAALAIEYGADVNAKNNYGRTPLSDAIESVAISQGDPELIQLLIDNGADPKYLDYEIFKQTHVYGKYYDDQIKHFLETNKFEKSKK